MKYLFLFFAFIYSQLHFAQLIDTTLVEYKGSKLYHIKCDSNTKSLIFLHGGVKNPAFNEPSRNIDLNFLLEGNVDLVPTALKNGFDLIVPISNEKMDWLNNHQYCYDLITTYLDSINSNDANYISGFSDGGTGSFKMFYDHPDYFEGLVVFNGYPQHKNFNQNADYKAVTNKPIIYFSTFGDHTIPYEFLLTEYCQQKKYNANTYLYIKNGGHTFEAYERKAIDLCFEILTGKTNCLQNEPIHGFIKEDQLINFYPFRKKMWKKYAYGKDFYLINRNQEKLYKGE